MTQLGSWDQDKTLFHLLIESVGDYAIFMLDSEGHILTWNPGAERIKGYQAAEVIGQHFSRFHPLEDVIAGKPARILQTSAVEGRYEEEGWRVRKDGSRFWANVVISAMRDETGRLRGFAKVTRDLTARQASIEQLRRSAEEVRQLLTILDHANIIIRDLQDRIMLWSSGAAQLYGYTKDQALNAVSHELLQPTFNEPLERIQDVLFKQGRWQGESIHRKSDHTTITVASTWVLHRNANGEPAAILEASTDITPQKAAEQALTNFAEQLEKQVQERTRRLQEANAELEAFAYTVAHDLRAPLRAVQGFSQAVLEDYGNKLDDTGRDYLIRNTKAAEELDGLIQDLLAYSKLSRMEVVSTPVHLEDSVLEVMQNLQESVRERKARIQVKKPLSRVLAHPSTLKQVIQNLLTNALKFVPPGESPEISLWAEEHDNKARLSVQDNGIGIAPEDHSRIFRVFERLHGGEAYAGTGIGLAIVQKGVERMGGQIGLESIPGTGSRFWIDLPRAD